VEISYLFKYANHDSLFTRAKQADIVFFVKRMPTKEMYDSLKIDKANLWVVGTKNFGVNSGLYYNYLGENYCEQETSMESGYLEANNELRDYVG